MRGEVIDHFPRTAREWALAFFSIRSYSSTADNPGDYGDCPSSPNQSTPSLLEVPYCPPIGPLSRFDTSTDCRIHCAVRCEERKTAESNWISAWTLRYVVCRLAGPCPNRNPWSSHRT